MKNPTTPNSLSRRDLLKRGSAVALGAAVGSQAITGFPTIWAQNIKNVTLRQDCIRLDQPSEETPPPNEVRGTVTAVEYKGTSLSVTLQLDGEQELEVTLPEQLLGQLDVSYGKQLAASWKPQDLCLLN